MKKILLSLLLSMGLYASASCTGIVLETLSSGGYTYMKVEESKKTYWIAMTQRDVKVGDAISYSEQGWMKDFHSKTLDRTFESILFASDAPTNTHIKAPSKKASIMESSHTSSSSISIADLFKNRDKYVGKIVTVKGKVTKTSAQIMKLNWIHIQDGSNFHDMNDLVFTSTQNAPQVGEIVYAKGLVVKDKDFGYGYFYPLIIQEASFSK
ncbi:GW dipeptide domain-containing protein [Sulfurimonas sp.]|jgi:hypothetical protein|uniref:GW dipeptide domain-containing protein n=1 Tax=Sulfurimonas sp. TaxID=2022749 RepID=UPI0025D91E77|nr:GW dipeptide domain-containing protein [Sulfurimonas sp.]MBT5934824.1 hypothetical protein [Sulfurimonas sp.]